MAAHACAIECVCAHVNFQNFSVLLCACVSCLLFPIPLLYAMPYVCLVPCHSAHTAWVWLMLYRSTHVHAHGC